MNFVMCRDFLKIPLGMPLFLQWITWTCLIFDFSLTKFYFIQCIHLHVHSLPSSLWIPQYRIRSQSWDPPMRICLHCADLRPCIPLPVASCCSALPPSIQPESECWQCCETVNKAKLNFCYLVQNTSNMIICIRKSPDKGTSLAVWL